MNKERLKALVDAAMGRSPCDLILKNARVVNVFNLKIEDKNVCVKNGFVVGFDLTEAAETVDLRGALLTPGLIDAHVHPESGMLEPAMWAAEIAALGTTCVVADPHEIANALGMDGVRFMINRAKGLPVKFYFMAPSCVPATTFETSGANLAASDLAPLLANKDGALGLAEMMNFPGAFLGFDDVLEKMAAADEAGAIIDGHAPGLGGRPLWAYLCAGAKTDHETISLAEAEEKLSLGMSLLIREGSAARNLDDLLPAVNDANWSRCMFCTDDRHPLDLKARGHVNQIAARAAEYFNDLPKAVAMATINAAGTYGMKRRGAVAPGFVADLCVWSELAKPPLAVYSSGAMVAENGKAIFEVPRHTGDWPNRFELPEISASDLATTAAGAEGPVIQVVAGQIITKKASAKLKIIDGNAVSDAENDVLKMVVAERYTGKAGMAACFVKGFGLRRGALATSVAHDSHNVVAVGASDEAIAAAVNAVAKAKGGLAAFDGEKTIIFPLPIAGLMSDRNGDYARKKLTELLAAAKALGCALEEPFMQLAFLALPVIPELKLTDKGLFDAVEFKFVDFYKTSR